MQDARRRIGALSGLAFVVLLVAAVILGDTTLIKAFPEPRFDASAAELAAYFAGAQAAQLLKAYLVVASGLALVGFLAEVTGAANLGGTASRPVAKAAFALGVLGSGFTVVGGGIVIPTILNIRHGIDPGEARIVTDISYAMYILSWVALAGCLALVAVNAVRMRTAPFWYGWPALAAAASLLLAAVAFPSYGWVWFVYDVFLLWVAITSISLTRGPGMAGQVAKFTGSAERLDPYRNFKFRIRWSDRYVAGASNVEPLGRGADVGERHGDGEPSTSHVSPRTAYQAITIERGVTHDPDFDNWARRVWKHGAGLGADAAVERNGRDLGIDVYDEAGRLTFVYKVYRAWVSEYQALPDLDANANAVAIAHMKIEHEGWERDADVPQPVEPCVTDPPR